MLVKITNRQFGSGYIGNDGGFVSQKRLARRMSDNDAVVVKENINNNNNYWDAELETETL